ncbi:MAG: hypothetical protein WC755_08990, partial [Candidatus Woesearchaeota archaeon]
PLFEELSLDAKINWSRNCNKRAKKLADLATTLSTKDDRLNIIQVEPILLNLQHGNTLPLSHAPFIYLKKTPDFPWSEFHMAFCWNDIVLDPAYGEPVKIKSYIPEAFDLRNTPLAKFTTTKYFLDHVEHEKTFLYDSRGRLIKEIYF